MSRFRRTPSFPFATLRQMLNRRGFFLLTCLAFLSLIWMQLLDTSMQEAVTENTVQEVILNVEKDARFLEVYRKTSRLPKGLKYILLWTDKTYAPLYYLGQGQRAFIENNCSYINCYVTGERDFKDDVTEFDAIAFNGRNLYAKDLPQRRSMHQKYIFFNMESAENYPVCQREFDGFFNWTSTYRLDSDIPFPYIIIKKKGKIIGPKRNMTWPKFPRVSEEFAEKLSNKSKAAAWFVSSCKSRSGRKGLVKRLEKALDVYNLQVDVYGRCGTLDCPRDKKETCNLLLEKDYYFYLSLENSFSEDYVTEKLLTALQHNVVPIVYGGADYSRFLPPNSYIDARQINAFQLASIIDRTISSPRLYQEFFRWKNHITYADPSATNNVCEVCAALNSDRVKQTTTYPEFRRWWHPSYQQRCSIDPTEKQ